MMIRYEGGSGGTDETINMYKISTGCVLESARQWC